MNSTEPTVTPAELRALLLAAIRPLSPRPCALADAHGLVLGEPVIASHDLPRFRTAAMDGFAVRADDAGTGSKLRLVGRAFAGHPFAGVVGPKECVAVATGAVVPDGADAVVPLEEAAESNEVVAVACAVEPRWNVRAVGEDVGGGSVVVPAGRSLGVMELMAAAAVGASTVTAHPRPRVVIVPTGDEVRPGGMALGPGEVHDAVSIPVAALLRQVGAEPVVRAPVPDDPVALAREIGAAAVPADALITVGGVSTGPRDLLVRAGEGTLRSFRVAMRPGKPFAFGVPGGLPVFGLPGNPFAAVAAFEELVRPCILRLMARAPVVRPAVAADLAEAVLHRPGRLGLLAVEVTRDGPRLVARPLGNRSHAGSSGEWANGWAVIPPDVRELPVGTSVDVRLADGPA